MPELIYPSSTRIKGPVLLDRKSLTELDEIISKEMDRLRSEHDKWIDERVSEVQEDLKRIVSERLSKDYPFERRLTLHLSNGTDLKCHSFADAATHPELSKNLATAFELEVRCGRITANLGANSKYIGSELTLDVSPSNFGSALNFFGPLAVDSEFTTTNGGVDSLVCSSSSG